ncbi:hypothetical protein CVT26_002591 [Gymnopilus dilepis]|uniref:Uncharacterized protein n=1 Tax=Gymnopilus dilepis TaxID=231916 RepID=A0A409VF49_9AGAR|nr:hypothetical protein CVT26_002591 [Gymnopilus dilepis]
MSTQVFVDDTDAGINYSTGWQPQTFTNGDATSLPVSPHYGTLHVPSTGVEFANFSYSFIGKLFFTFGYNEPNAESLGTSITAWFLPKTPTATIRNCTIDGHQKGMIFREVSLLACQTQSALQPGQHKLFVNIEPSTANSLSMDYLSYTPSGDTSGQDLLYNAGAPAIITPDPTFAQGAILDLEFTGYSLGMYAQFFSGDSHTPSIAQYSIDNQPLINFTIQNPTTSSNPTAGPQLVLQTPRYTLERHLFRFVFQGTSQTVPFQPFHVVVQNNTSHLNLQPFPLLSSSSQASKKNADNNTLRIGIAIGVVASILTILAFILCIFFIRRRRRALQLEDSDPASLARPFMIPRILRIEPLKRQRVDSEAELTSAKPSAAGDRTLPVAASPHRPNQRVFVHVDSEDQRRSDEADEEDILELPPAYRSAVQAPTVPGSMTARPFLT